jgi:tetratricopeptide (TPR) repeat protein
MTKTSYSAAIFALGCKLLARVQSAGASLCLAIGFLMVCAGASAQTIESLEWVGGTQSAIARITFNANVRFLQQSPMGPGDLVQLSFQIVAADDAVLMQSIEEGKRLARSGDRVGMALTYAPTPNSQVRSMTLRFTEKVRVLARQGPGARAIDLSFVGANGAGGASASEQPLPAMAIRPDERRYIVVLQTFALDQVAEMPRVAAQFQDYAVFTRKLEQDGQLRFALAMGYFRTQADAQTVRDRAADRFPSASVLQSELLAPATAVARGAAGTPRTAPAATQASETGALATDGKGPVAPPAKALAELVALADERRYVVLLQTFARDEVATMPRVAAQFQDYAVFTRSMEQDGSQRFVLAMGYFRTREEAQSVRDRAAGSFPTASVLPLELLATAPTAAAKPVSAVVASAAATTGALAVAEAGAGLGLPDAEAVAKLNSQAAELLQKGQLALSQQRWQDAVAAFNQALMLPPNRVSQQAQELIGAAWEGLKQNEKARIEYQLYLRLYPQGEAVQRVTQRLNVLGPAMASSANATDKPDAAQGLGGLISTGSISQYYYGGRSKTDSLVNIAANIDQKTLSRTNQSTLVTSVDLSGRYKSENSETKLVLRDTYSKNFITSTNTQSGLSAVYVDYRFVNPQLNVRLGRQSAIGGSLFGLFDGVSLAMPVSAKFKLDAMAGVPANTLVTAPSQRLAGLMLEADNLFDHWGGNISLVDQTTQGISDRRAAGFELRYFGDAVSMYSQLDYDLNFRTLNAATLQGSMQGPLGTTMTLLLDSRKAPSLQLSDALISSGTTSLMTLLQLKSLAEVKDMALGTAAQARQAMFSVSRALSPKWQGSLDLRYSDVGALPAVGDFQAMPATGAQYNVSMQLTGSNLYSSRDINGLNLSVIRSDTLRGTQLAYNNLTGFLDNKASFEPSIRIYTQTDSDANKVLRISPGVRFSYKLSDRASLLGETIYERSTIEGPTNHEESSAVFFYVGYRYDFY